MIDKKLVSKAKEGSTQAFEKLVQKYQNRVFTIAYRIMGNYEDADDIAQEAFFRAYKSLQGFRGESTFLTWIGRIATNLCMDELRRRGRMGVEISLDEEIFLHDGEVTRQLADDAPTADELFIGKEMKKQIQRHLNLLKEEYRTIIVLRDIYGYTYEEISEQLDLNLGTVKSRLSRARNALAKKLQPLLKDEAVSNAD